MLCLLIYLPPPLLVDFLELDLLDLLELGRLEDLVEVLRVDVPLEELLVELRLELLVVEDPLDLRFDTPELLLVELLLEVPALFLLPVEFLLLTP